jgi:hypothetical protein
VKAVINVWVPKIAGMLSGCTTGGLSGSTQHHRVSYILKPS